MLLKRNSGAPLLGLAKYIYYDRNYNQVITAVRNDKDQTVNPAFKQLKLTLQKWEEQGSENV